MRKLTGTLLAWLLLFAIPIHGLAATAVLFCGAGHHGVLAQTSVPPVPEHHAEMHAKAEHSQDELRTTSSPGFDQAKSATDSQHGKWTQGHVAGDDKCSAYSVTVGTLSVGHFSVTGSEQIPYAREFFVNYTPKRLDPPPRAVLC